uniref:RNA polymerase sigma factor n=1 Tax=Fulvivirga sp. TaxID=1931237 RepID=UPI00404AE3D0
LQAWKSVERFRGDSQFSTWLYRISLNTVMTFIRKEGRLKKESLDTELPITMAVNEQSDRSMKLMFAIKQLNDIDKSIITLHLDDYGNDEIAEILGISKNNVAVKIHRIKEELKKKMKG